MEKEAWVSFCISTFKRPELLKKQLELLLQQRFPDFEIIVSDNDPDATAQPVTESMEDDRIRYFHNGDNLGMIRSFNRSIERASAPYIVMVTDDDPIEIDFLADFRKIYDQYPDCSVYCGFMRKNTHYEEIELIDGDNFIAEILNTNKTPKILWSSSIMKKEAVLTIGCIPDYGSPHLADHALIAMVGSVGGAVLKNRMYSSLTSHNTNFSKSHIETYLSGCKGFYQTITAFVKGSQIENKVARAVSIHLGIWFIGSVFNLKKFYTLRNDPAMLAEINRFSSGILQLPFMKQFKTRYHLKSVIFSIKKSLHLLK